MAGTEFTPKDFYSECASRFFCRSPLPAAPLLYLLSNSGGSSGVLCLSVAGKSRNQSCGVVPSPASGRLPSHMPHVAFFPSGAVTSAFWLAVLLIRSLGRGRAQLRNL